MFKKRQSVGCVQLLLLLLLLLFVAGSFGLSCGCKRMGLVAFFLSLAGGGGEGGGVRSVRLCEAEVRFHNSDFIIKVMAKVKPLALTF